MLSGSFLLTGPVVLLQATSLPVVVVSATTQVSSAWASIMWWSMSTSDLTLNPLASQQVNRIIICQERATLNL